MKKLSTISLFIFGVVVASILTAGLVFYQNNKSGVTQGAAVQSEVNKITASGQTITLNMAEISKHNKSTDCWMLISGNVYDITSFFGSHPGGNRVMADTCGTDATDAYLTKDPNATSTAGGQDHSSRAREMLKDYYLGVLNGTIGSSTTKTANSNAPSTSSKATSSTTVKTETAKNQNIIPVTSITLNMTEIAKHNKQSDCFMLISGKVYNITSFFGSHPGGNSVMAATCGTDATAAYMTKDPNATSSGSRSSHSSNAVNMLASYYIGDLNQTIGQQKVTETNAVPAPANTGDDDYEEEDDD